MVEIALDLLAAWLIHPFCNVQQKNEQENPLYIVLFGYFHYCFKGILYIFFTFIPSFYFLVFDGFRKL